MEQPVGALLVGHLRSVAVVAPHGEQFGFDQELVTQGVQRGDDVLTGMPAPVVVVGAGA